MSLSVNTGWYGNAWYNNINTLALPYLISMIQTMTVSTWCQSVSMSSCEQHQLACNYILYLIILHLPNIQIMDINIYIM